MPSTFGETDDDSDLGNYESGSDDGASILPASHGPYGLRNSLNVDINNMEKSDIVR